MVPDHHVDEIVRAALIDAHAAAAGQVQQSGSAPELWTSAIAAMAALAERTSHALAAEIMQLLLPLIERELGRYRFTDNDQMRALVGIARGHAQLRDEALRQIGRAFDVGGALADAALKHGSGLMSSDSAAVPILLELAVGGNGQACLLLASRGHRSAVVLEKADAAFDRVVQRPPPKAGTVTFGTTLPHDAHLIGVLSLGKRDSAAKRLMQIAEDQSESDWNRAQALEAIAILGRDLSSETRADLYSRALRFATGEGSGSSLSPDLRQSPHPLSRFRLDISLGPLEAFGIEAAGRLARSEGETNVVVDLALSTLSTADANTTHQLAAILSWLGGTRMVNNQAVLASQPNHSLRALAAVIWVHDANRDPGLGDRLAADRNVLVRRTLASEIAEREAFPQEHPVRARLSSDDHYSVRRALRGARW